MPFHCLAMVPSRCLLRYKKMRSCRPNGPQWKSLHSSGSLTSFAQFSDLPRSSEHASFEPGHTGHKWGERNIMDDTLADLIREGILDSMGFRPLLLESKSIVVRSRISTVRILLMAKIVAKAENCNERCRLRF